MEPLLSGFHKECIDCKQSHYIPNEKVRCLPCGFKESKKVKTADFIQKAKEEYEAAHSTSKVVEDLENQRFIVKGSIEPEITIDMF